MPSPAAPDIAAVRTQRLLLEFAQLKHARLQGIYVTLTPNNPRRWPGVLFVREGPYASAVLRFEISFPSAYPSCPPLIALKTDIFHPLVAPSTSQLYSESSTTAEDDIGSGLVQASNSAQGTVAGVFSLKHAFPGWLEDVHMRKQMAGPRRPTPWSVIDVLRYMRSTFDDTATLDALPLAAAADSGAWRAWQTHRRTDGVFEDASREDASSESDASSSATQRSDAMLNDDGGLGHDWNWDGVWEERVCRCIQNSIADSALYGQSGARNELIQFWKVDGEELDAIKDAIEESLTG